MNTYTSTTDAKDRSAGGPGFLHRPVGGDDTTVIHVLQLAVFFLVTLAVTVGVVMVDWSPGQTQLEPGDIADRTYKANQDASYISEIRTEEARREAFDSVSNIVKTFDPEVRETQLGELRSFVENATEIRSSDASEADKVDQLQSLLPSLDEESARQILAVSNSSWEAIATEATRLVDETMTEELEGTDAERARENLDDRASPLLTTVQRDLAVTIGAQYISPNVFIDDEATQEKRRAAQEAVEPVLVTVKEGQAIVRDGNVITERDIEALEALGLLETSSEWTTRLGLAGMMAALTVALTVYLYLFNREIWRHRQLVLVGIVVLGPILVGRLLLPHPDFQFVLPVAASAMLLAILINIQFASIISIILAMYLGIVADLSLELALLYFLASIAGAFVIWRADRTITFIWAGIAVAMASFATGIAWFAINEDLSAQNTGRLLLETGIAGALAASLTFLSFSILGSLFGITTNLQLQELAHPRQPLLNRLAREAPGTYHHSIIVSNLAESALTKVGGDPLFARVAVLYHDIGKVEHPTFFVENQANIGNIHDGLDPRVSAQIIIDHVRDGVKIAKRARLPKSIVDVIAQHHGTTRVEYFYRRALETDPTIDPAEFTYPGPKPQSREAAVIMLADSVEAAVRSMAQSNKLFDRESHPDREAESNRLADFVHGIIKARIDSGQLDECDLTFRDINLIEESFIQILEGIYHPRVEYPEEAAREEKATQPELAQTPAVTTD